MNKSMNSLYPVNCHLHTPYSFSAFSSIKEIFQLAQKENIRVVGINDFFTTDGYDEFNSFAVKYKIYPLFNIEFIGLSKEFQQQGIRINDPNNPGRIYLSGKGLKYPFSLPEEHIRLLKSVQEESQQQVKEMIGKVNKFFKQAGIGIRLDYDEIRTLYAKSLVRERHLAKAVYETVQKRSESSGEKANNLLSLIYSGAVPSSPINDRISVENEIRSRLFKSGGIAFVPEDESAFLSVSQITEIVIAAGGIPCYPVLLDDAKGAFTDFEKDYEKMHNDLVRLKIGCIELIPNRNSSEVLEKFVSFFRTKNFPVCFGTEHNSPGMIPLIPACRKNVPLSDNLEAVSFESACLIAAHQQLVKDNKPGFTDIPVSALNTEIIRLADIGKSLIERYIA
jgi:hypothetical protein